MSPAASSPPARTANFTGRVNPAPAPRRVPITGSALTSRPNDGSGFWPDFSNTGYLYSTATPTSTAIPCTHGYTGVYDYQAGMTATGSLFVDGSSPQVFNRYHFRGKIYLALNSGDNFTFGGCVFDGTWPNDNLVPYYVNTHLTFSYCTFRPAEWRSPTSTPQFPPGNSGNVSSCSDSTNDTNSDGTPYNNSWQYIAQAVNGGQTGSALVFMTRCDVWGNAGMEILGTNGSSSLQGTVTGCYIHDQSDPWGHTYHVANPGGTGYYHNDGIGPDSDGGLAWFNVTGNTIASMGNTNGIAMQGTTNYSHIVITGNYISGWGEATAVGATGTDANTSCLFRGNIFSGEVVNVGDPAYSGHQGNPGNGNGACSAYNNISAFASAAGNSWRSNFYQVRAGDPELSLGMNGQFWWPTDNSGHATDYTG